MVKITNFELGEEKRFEKKCSLPVTAADKPCIPLTKQLLADGTHD